MTGTARIYLVGHITGRGWAISLDELSHDFVVSVGDFVTLEKNGIQLSARLIQAVDFMDKRGTDGKMRGYVSLILSDRHSRDLSEFGGGIATITSN